MTTTLTPLASTTAPADRTRPVGRIARAGIASGLGAAAANLAVSAGARQFDVSLEIREEAIPVFAFPQLTLIAAILGIGLAAVFARRAHRPGRTFVVTTVILTALSMVPPLLADADFATKVVLGLTHIVAAIAIIPTIASRLPD